MPSMEDDQQCKGNCISRHTETYLNIGFNLFHCTKNKTVLFPKQELLHQICGEKYP